MIVGRISNVNEIDGDREVWCYLGFIYDRSSKFKLCVDSLLIIY